MRSARLFIPAVLVFATALSGRLLGQGVITYTVSLQADTPVGYVESWEASDDPPQAFVGGSSADGQSFDPDATITWDVSVAVSGGDPSNGGAPYHGAANLVWTLVLLDNNFNPVPGFGAASLDYTNEVPCSNAIGGDAGTCGLCNAAPVSGGFYSAINDGDCDGLRGFHDGVGVDRETRQNAAFTNLYNVVGGFNAQIWQEEDKGGPGLHRREYPSAMGFPPAATSASGFLVGMGAGYPQFEDGVNTAGVGVGLGTGTFGCELGTIPVAEGQISLQGLTGGVYYLALIAGVGNNVLKSTIDCTGSVNSFADPALTVVTNADAMIQFQVGEAALPQVFARRLFYDNSFYDSALIGCTNIINGGQPCTDDTAIDASKTAAVPGGPMTTFANYTSYARGINGIMIDIANASNPAGITSADFVFTNTGRDGPGMVGIGAFADVPAAVPASVTVRPGEGVFGSDRVVITWNNPDGATGQDDQGTPIPFPNNRNAWLQVDVLNTANTGLADTFWFGVAQGEGNIGNTVDAFPVAAGDQTATRDCALMGPGACGNQFTNPKPVSEPLDYDKNGLISQAADFDVARNNPAVSSLTQSLRAFTPPGF